MTIWEDTSCGTCGTGTVFFPQGIHAKQARPGRTSSPGSERGQHHNARASLVTSPVIVITGHAQSTCVRRAPPAAAGTKPFTLLRHAASAHPIIFMPCIVG